MPYRLIIMNVYLCLLKNYNNYYNRKVLRGNNLTDYITNHLYKFLGAENQYSVGIAFNPNDGINTSQIINWDQDWTPDYLLVLNKDNPEIISRWFVIESKRTRASQYLLTLKRDVIADYYDNIKNSPMFIEKATIDSDDVAIHNKEDFQVNQIKKNEKLIKDKTKTSWITLYYDKTKRSELHGSFLPTNPNLEDSIIISTPIEQWNLYEYTQNPFYDKNISKFEIYLDLDASSGALVNHTKYTYRYFPDGSIEGSTKYLLFGIGAPTLKIATLGFNYTQYFKENLDEKYESIRYAINTAQGESEDVSNILSLEGKTIVDSTGKVFKIKIQISQSEELGRSITEVAAANAIARTIFFDSVEGNLYSQFGGSYSDSSFKYFYNERQILIILEEQDSIGADYDLTDESKAHTNDSPYDIIQIPYPEDTRFDTDGTHFARLKRNVAIAFAQSLIINHPTIFYDIQLLPYFALESVINIDRRRSSSGEWVNVIDSLSDESLFTDIVDENDSLLSRVYHIPASSFSFNMTEFGFNPELPGELSRAESFKIRNQCDFYRIVSPNYNGQFEFNDISNGGSIGRIFIDCTYKPYNPYIHLSIDFKDLYGSNFGDARGLICGGDFSLPMVTDSWQKYQIENKNYQNIFDRQIENMEKNNSYQRVNDIFQAIGGTFTGAAGGAITGSASGNPTGAITGGTTGALLSMAAGAADVVLKEQLRNEAIDFTKDNFGYSLGNIQALPRNLNRVSSFTANNKIYPILEYYSCTITEKEALLSKMKYNGMTVMRIGTIEEFLRQDLTYIKGKLIRLEDISEDFHLINDIAQELNKGVFI